ncbi:MAG TPA: hypothetical protein VK177_10515 [Flavobacteriales bacterium]|nr:hypothetical protein [Flavobacteriales bacterium]
MSKEGMKKNPILSDWNMLRILRLFLGISILIQGFVAGEWLLVLGGALFSLMPLLNIGCCGQAGCNAPISKNEKKMEDITYEEVH